MLSLFLTFLVAVVAMYVSGNPRKICVVYRLLKYIYIFKNRMNITNNIMAPRKRFRNNPLPDPYTPTLVSEMAKPYEST